MIEQNKYQITQKRHSRLGIASVAIAFILPCLLVSFIVVSGILEADKNPLRNSIQGYFIVVSLLFPVLHLIALILALIGVFSKKTKKLFPVIGIVLNALLLLAGVGLILFLLTVLSIPVR